MSDELHKLPGPLLLLAGPGTGKTYRLARRIKYLVEEQNVSSDSITVITFTVAAAKNMRERISDPSRTELYVPHDKQPKMIYTMHKLGHRIINEKASALGFVGKVNVVSSDRLRNILVEDAAQLASLGRDDAKETASCRQFGKCNRSGDKKCKICDEYRNILQKCSAIDYDDQIFLACKLLKEDADLLNKYRSYCKYLLVDEYQDINAGQFELIFLLSEGQREGLFVVGDDDQSIYSWRGGSPEFIRNFKTHFGEKSQVKPLQKSYRCTPHVLEGAISVVSNYDASRLQKGQFESTVTAGEKIEIHSVPSSEKEAVIIKTIVERTIPRSILVLVPHRGFIEPIANALRKAKIKYSAPLTLPGEGLPLISVLSEWISDNFDSLAFRECLEAYINNSESRIPSWRSKKPEKLKERESKLSIISSLWKKIDRNGCNSFWKVLEAEKDNNELCKTIYDVFHEILVLNNNQDNPADFISNITKKMVLWKKTKDFIEEIDSWVEMSGQFGDILQKADVQLMTLQGAKGLEADVVCVIGLEEGTIPRKNISTEQLAEQSRLMYVSMTRAMEELHLFCARKRSGAVMFKQIYKKGEPPDIKPSCFIDSIPPAHKDFKYHQA